MVERGFGLLLAQAFLNEAFGATAWGVPPTLFFALSTSLEADPMAEPVEGIGGYDRAQLPNDLGSWYLSTGAEAPALKRNARRIVWPISTGPWSSGSAPLRSWACYTTRAGAGALIVRGAISTEPPTVTAPGITLEIAAADMEITVEAFA